MIAIMCDLSYSGSCDCFVHPFVLYFLLFPMSLVAEADSSSSGSKKLGLRVQKKILGKVATKKTVKAVIDDDTYLLIDEVTALVAAERGEKQADKFLTDLIKITVKIGILIKNDQFSPQEVQDSLKFRQKLHSLIMTFISFHDVAFTYDRAFLVSGIEAASAMVHSLVKRHLTEKSHKRIDNVFGVFNGDFLDKLFQPNSEHTARLDKIVPLMTKLMDEGKL